MHAAINNRFAHHICHPSTLRDSHLHDDVQVHAAINDRFVLNICHQFNHQVGASVDAPVRVERGVDASVDKRFRGVECGRSWLGGEEYGPGGERGIRAHVGGGRG